MELLRIVVLLPLFFAIALTLTLPDTSEIATFTNRALGGIVKCDPGKRILSRQRPRHTDCANAIRQLRDNNEDGQFHEGGVRNQWQLPVSKYYDTCVVNVTMKSETYIDTTSWQGVGVAASQLNTACVGTSVFTILQGGFTETGRFDFIKISLEYRPPNRFEVGQNGTFTGAGNSTVAGMLTVN